MNTKNFNKLLRIEQIIEDNIGKTLTDETATDIYQLTNDLLCSNRDTEHIGITIDEHDIHTIGYKPSKDIVNMMNWKKDMDECVNVEECIIYRIERTNE